MKVIILGVSGMLGGYMSRYLGTHHECIDLYRSDFDATELDSSYFKTLIRKGDVVINCVGILKPYIDNVGIANTILINSVFPQMIADICTDRSARFIHISSDCVFAGKRGQYTEDDICDAQDTYGKTKALEPTGAVTLRTSFIGEDISEDGVGLLQWILSHKNKIIHGYDNCMWNGITCLQLAKLVNDIITIHPYPYCLRHIFSPQVISKYDLCNIVNDIYDLNMKVVKCSAESISWTAIDGVLDRSLATKFPDLLNIPDIRDQLIEQKSYGL